jgi:uncharacterized protein with NRDE domain
MLPDHPCSLQLQRWKRKVTSVYSEQKKDACLMCLIVFAWRPGHERPLVLASNRDEFYARPTLTLAPWPDAPGVCAGRDLDAGGTWLGVGPDGRFAAVTNIRGRNEPGRRSRGELCAAYLSGEQSLAAYARHVCAHGSEYAGFNLLLSDGQQLYYLTNDSTAPEPLGEGVYGLSNAALNTPWPKLLKARRTFEAQLDGPSEHWLDIMADPTQASDAELPETGVGLVTERLLSSAFIASATYGTRASSALIVYQDGRRSLTERTFGPGGGVLGQVTVEV